MEVRVVTGVETDRAEAAEPGMRIRLLGPLAISRAGAPVTLPQSRKVRALIAYLALAPRAVARDYLCELLWDVPNNPRGELRWCLSKVRNILDETAQRRVATAEETVRLDVADCFVDALEIDRASRTGIATLDLAQLRALAALFAGDFLQSLEISRSAPFSAWLLAQRRHFRAAHVAIVEHLVARLPDTADEIERYVGTWLQLAPFDRRAHEFLFDTLARRGRLRDGDEHLATVRQLFETEGLDAAPIGRAWREARARHTGAMVSVAMADVHLEPAPAEDWATAPTRRPSIAVMPFYDQTATGPMRGGLADGLAHDVITRLAKLRSLFVIAQGTVFALDERSVGAEEAGRTLNVDYVTSGSLLRRGTRLSVTVQLTETRSARILWADVFDATPDDAFLVLETIGDRIVAAIANQIEMAERNRAVLKPPNSLSAWEAHHRGLWHMYRFSRDDNARARQFFEMAVRLDPTFARAHAGLSFTHFQDAFQGWMDRTGAIERAFATAAQGCMVDDRDPAAHWAMGRALWLRGQQDQALLELDAAVDLSPSFALAHYTLAFVHAQSGDPLTAIRASDRSRDLSPFDPLMFGMLATRALALLRLGDFAEAARWAVMAAARPNAHAHIRAIAAHCLALVEQPDEARALLDSIQLTLPAYRIDDLVAAFHFSADLEALFRRAGERIRQ